MSPSRRTRFIVFTCSFAVIEPVVYPVDVAFTFRKTLYPQLPDFFLNSQEIGIVAIINLLIPFTLPQRLVCAWREKLLI